MKLITYKKNGEEQLAFIHDDQIFDTNLLDDTLPSNMETMLNLWTEKSDKAQSIYQQIKEGKYEPNDSFSKAEIMAPVPHPTSCRDAYAFRQHVASARKNRGVDMIPEFDQFPIWYFTNHNAIQGPGDVLVMPDQLERLDYELEASIVIGRKGRNITASQADDYIAGYMVMNDWSARRLQMEEMKLNLGPAKGKDFSTAIGPMLVTPDEFADKKVSAKDGHVGDQYSLDMKCWVNGELLSQGNMSTMDWTFAEIVERAAYGADIYPGDVIGSGTVGTGCLLELNGTAKLNDPNAEPQWIKDGDVVEMEIEGLGRLVNTVRAVDSDFSLFALKKNM